MASGRRCCRSSASPRLYRYCAFAGVPVDGLPERPFGSRQVAAPTENHPERVPVRSAIRVELDGFLEERRGARRVPMIAQRLSQAHANQRVLRQQRERFLVGGDRGRQAAPPAPDRRLAFVELRVFGRGGLPALKRGERGIEVADRDLRVGERQVGGARGRQPFDGACEMGRGLAVAFEPDERAAEVIVDLEAVDAAADQATRAGRRSRRTGARAAP